MTPLNFDAATTPLKRGTTLLEASAGTGKTYSLTTVAVRLLIEPAEDGHGPALRSIDRLLMVTFTRAATDELRQRLRRRLGEAERALSGTLTHAELTDPWLAELSATRSERPGAREAVRRARREFDSARIQTIHSFCGDLLREGAFEAGLPVDIGEATSTSDLLELAATDVYRRLLYSGSVIANAMVYTNKLGLEMLLGTLRKAQNHSDSKWIPLAMPLQDAEAAVLAAVENLDASELVRARDAYLEVKGAWLAKGAEISPMIDQLRGGIDLDDITHWQALHALRPLEDGRALGAKVRDGRLEQAWYEPLRAVLDALDQYTLNFRLRFLEEAQRRFVELKREHAVLDFDDLIAEAWHRLEDERSGASLAHRIAERFDAALVDEFQDTDSTQWRIFSRLFRSQSGVPPRHVLLLVGDPKQAIYGFRGADVFAYLEARAQADELFSLPKNYRSHPELIGAVNAVFNERPEESFLLDGFEFHPVEAGQSAESASLLGDTRAALQIITHPSPKLTRGVYESWATEQLVDEIRGLLAKGIEVGAKDGREALHAGHIAVLVRTHDQSRRVMRALRQVGIDAVLSKSGDIFDTEAMREWICILDSLLHFTHRGLRMRARATRLWGDSLASLAADADDNAIALWTTLRDLWRRRGFAAMATRLLHERSSVRRGLREPEGERFVTDLRHAFEFLQHAEHEHGLSPEGMLRWVAQNKEARTADEDRRQLRLDRDSEAVQVVTIFASKGLEYEVVFVPYSSHDKGPGGELLTAHVPQADGSFEPILDFAGTDEEIVDRAYLEDFAGRMRLFYVALTRAKRRCVFFLASTKRGEDGAQNSAPAFLMARAEDELPVGTNRVAWMKGAVAALDDSRDQWVDRIESRCEKLVGVEGVTMERCEEGSLAVRPKPTPPTLTARDFPSARRTALQPWRLLSYSSLAHQLHDRGQDLLLVDQADPSLRRKQEDRTPSGIFAFARGARAGICLHEVLEKSDFSQPMDDRARSRVDRILTKHGLADPADHRGPIDPLAEVVALVERVSSERIPSTDVSFADVTKERRLDEWKFTLSVSEFDPSRIADLIESTWPDPKVAAVASRLRAMKPENLTGYLAGFVDLIIEAEGKWYVFDWKSNDLGDQLDDYDEASTWNAMVESDYVLQAVFYLTALHRYLRSRIPDYEYEQHVAGAAYVFVRGLCGRDDRGWAVVDPPLGCIAALDALFGGGVS